MAYEVSERRACRALGFPRATHRYQSIRDDRAKLRIRLRDLAAARVRYGYRRLHLLLQREGRQVNHKLVYRIYCEEEAPRDTTGGARELLLFPLFPARGHRRLLLQFDKGGPRLPLPPSFSGTAGSA